ncbi:HAUS augmin-like complex subunit 6 N-terminus-domain-containing protein [Nemania sp. FL0916]|nr:HAUS augmin-like complex subunit 6 N-terminus-domain-containing protein [Nemania sp. FL0916]
MSSYQPNSSLARTRSLRAPVKPALTAAQTSAPSTSKTTQAQAQIPACTSNVLLFLTNARLLDLDLEPDWPDITPTTFSAKDAAGGQKKRIQCVEWALYQLFSLWDYQDAQNKLRPFYPPADQVQSINLRAALVRSLEAAKKNGVLGRDVLIRKTMLDECKGERLEEVLAVFSSAVLKKFVAEAALNSGPEHTPSISERISLENWGYTGDRTELNGLLLAHKAVLKSMLAKKSSARDKYRSFEEFLATKERRILQRRKQAESDAQDEPLDMSGTERNEIRRIINNNWTGNEQWLDGLLSDGLSQLSGILNTPFDEVWSGVQAGNITDMEEQTVGLLDQLEQRVHYQQTRLQKWEDFRKSTFGDIRPQVAPKSPPKEKKEDTGFDFTAHLHIDFDKTTSDYMDWQKQPPEYAKLLDGLTAELDMLKRTKIPDFSSLTAATRRAPANTAAPQLPSQEPVSDPVSDLSDWEDDPEEAVPPPQIRVSSAGAVHGESTAARRQLPVPHENRRKSPPRRENSAGLLGLHRRVKTEPHANQIELRPDVAGVGKPKSAPRYEESQALDRPLDRLQPAKRTKNTMPPPPRPKSPTQVLADEILNSMDNASPSPMKKSRYTLTLAERTRMSMSRTTSLEMEDDTPPVSPVKTSHTRAISQPVMNDDPEPGEDYEDLITRTRRSMAGFEAARQKAQLERRRSQRKSKIVPRKDSYFPKVDEEATGELSVVEGLIEDGQEDYEAVFKSRPRIATSPSPNPNRYWHEEN